MWLETTDKLGSLSELDKWRWKFSPILKFWVCEGEIFWLGDSNIDFCLLLSLPLGRGPSLSLKIPFLPYFAFFFF